MMPFAKAFEGFVTRLAVHLSLIAEDELKQQLNQVAISSWLAEIRSRLPDPRRYGEICAALDSAWQCRHKALHSDFAHPLSTLETCAEADQEIAIILRAMGRAHRIFIVDGLQLTSAAQPASEAPGPPSELCQSRIGVDESGKGDLFGPLVVAGVLLTPNTEDILARRGVRDSKTLADSRILELSKLIKENCPFEVLSLPPPQYDLAYQQHGRNLNRLLAWAHAQVIDRLGQRVRAGKAISDQFGEESLLIEAIETVGCTIPVEQRHKAEQ